MPISKPQQGESKDGFMSRCMNTRTMHQEYPDRDQRLAVCGAQIKKQIEKQQNNKFYKELHALADKAEPKVRRAIIKAIKDFQSGVSLSAVQTAIETGSEAAIIRALGLEGISKALGPIADDLLILFNQAAQASIETLPKEIGTKIAFDLTNPKSIELLRRTRLDLITNISQSTEKGIREIVRTAFEEGGHPHTQAHKIKNMVGLLPKHAKAVRNFRALLESEGVPKAKVEKRVAAYRERLLRWRARNIARTETIRAANLGQRALWQQGIDQGLLNKSEIRVKFIVTPDDRLCPICAPLAGKTVEFDRPFVSTVKRPKAGLQRFSSLTPPLHPQCRCALGLVFNED